MRNTPRNPFLVALITLTIIAAAIAGICALVGAAQAGAHSSYLDNAPGVFALAAAWSWSLIAGAFLIATLVTGALTWTPTPARPSSPPTQHKADREPEGWL